MKFDFEDGSSINFDIDENGFRVYIQSAELLEDGQTKIISTTASLDIEETAKFINWIRGIING